MINFRNIDEFIPSRFENVGMLKGKRWYIDSKKDQKGLFKPQRKESIKNVSIFCANHYGEVAAYILASRANVRICEAELAHLSKYFPNIHKEKHHGTPIEKNGCITYSKVPEKGKRTSLIPGEVILEKFFPLKMHGAVDRHHNFEDDIDLCLTGVELKTRECYENQGLTSEEINERVARNIDDTIKMIVFDCLYGNNDRHNENWSMRLIEDPETNKTDIELYDLYDNERILGLYENQDYVRYCIEKDTVVKSSDKDLFSRMILSNEKNQHSSYKDILEYLMQKFPFQTRKAIQEELDANSVGFVEDLLRSFEGLPPEYVQFGTQVFESRSEYAKELLKRFKTQSEPLKRDNNQDKPLTNILPKPVLPYDDKDLGEIV